MTSFYQFRQQTAKLYKTVIDDVATNVKEAFLDEGIDETILKEMKQVHRNIDLLWEAKVLATKSIDTFDPQPPETPVQKTVPSMVLDASMSNQNTLPQHLLPSVPNPLVTPSATASQLQPPRQHIIVRPASSNLPTAATLVIPQPANLLPGAPTRIIMPLQVPANTLRLINTTGQQFPAGLRIVAVNTLNSGAQLQLRPQQAQQINNNNNNSNNHGNDGNIPQLDGPTGSCTCTKQETRKIKRRTDKTKIVQLDGPGGVNDGDDDDVDEDDDFPAEDDDDIEEDFDLTGYIDEGEPLNSDDDDLVNENAQELFEADDIGVCQFEKVTRAKNKWRFLLKDAILNIDGKDYAFNKVVGESEF